MTPPNQVLVEFFGLPGVGKSALSRRVAEQLAARGVSVSEPSYALAHGMGRTTRRLGKAVHVLRELVLHPISSLRAARAIAATDQPSRALTWNLTFNWLLVLALTRRARQRHGAVLLDQGVLQAVWSIGLDGNAKAALALVDSLPHSVGLPDICVIVEAGASTVEQRLNHRLAKDSRVDRQRDRLAELLARGGDLLQSIRVRLVPLGAAPTLVMANENGADLDQLASQLVNSITESMAAVEMVHAAVGRVRTSATRD
jgi:AAA domain